MSVEDAVEANEAVIEKLEKLDLDGETGDESERRSKPRLSDEERRRQWEEKQASKPIVATGVKGKVKWYSVRNKYGFIEREDGEKDLFVHQTAISKSSIVRYFLRTLADEEEVEFDVVEGDKGLEAANVSGPDGVEVLGSKYYYVLFRGRSNRGRNDSSGEKRGNRRGSAKGEADDNEKPRKKRASRPRRRNAKKDKAPKGNEDGNASESEEHKSEEKPARRRRASLKETAVAESGDAALGGAPAPPAAVN